MERGIFKTLATDVVPPGLGAERDTADAAKGSAQKGDTLAAGGAEEDVADVGDECLAVVTKRREKEIQQCPKKHGCLRCCLSETSDPMLG